MTLLMDFLAMQRIRKKKNSSLSSVLVFAAAQPSQGTFCYKELAYVLNMKPSEVRYILKKNSDLVRDCGNGFFCKREKLNSLYKKALLRLENGELQEAIFSDIEKQEVKIEEPLIDYFMEVVEKYGDCMSLLEMAILLAVYEGCTSLSAIQKRLKTEDSLEGQLDHIASSGLLKAKVIDGEAVYTFTAKSADIFKIIFKARGGS